MVLILHKIFKNANVIQKQKYFKKMNEKAGNKGLVIKL